jgi:hypothetical protein
MFFVWHVGLVTIVSGMQAILALAIIGLDHGEHYVDRGKVIARGVVQVP